MKPKLFLVDDEQIIREGIENMIDWDRIGISLSASCANAFAALDGMMDEMPDILMTDIKMPGMDGLELIERALTLNPSLQCIVLSGYEEFAFAKKAMEMGVRRYLLKPCTQAEMEEALLDVRQKMEAQYARIRGLQDERQELVFALVEKLLQLKGSAEGDDEGTITAEQVRKVSARMGDPSLLREAFVYIVTHHALGLSQVQWGFDAVQDAYNVENLETHVAKGLTHLLPDTRSHRPFVSRMVEYIRKYYDHPELSLQYLADHVVHMNADYIGKEFARDMGMKVSAYLLSVRMERAKAMIRTGGDLHVYEVAEHVGLGHNPNYFSCLFCKYVGMTPKEYRNQG